MDNKFNSLAFFKGNYLKTYHADRYDFKDDDVDYKKMFSDIAVFISILTRNQQHMKIWTDEYCVVVEYNDQDESLSGVSLDWLGDDEFIGSYEHECENCKRCEHCEHCEEDNQSE